MNKVLQQPQQKLDMTREDYCSYELSKLLKEKGFDGECIGCYWDSKKIFDINYEPLSYSDGDLRDEVILAPTHQMAMKWLREVHKIFVVIKPRYYGLSDEVPTNFMYEIWSRYDQKIPVVSGNTHEEAVEAAIKYTLENLI